MFSLAITGNAETIVSQSSSRTVTVTTACNFLLDKKNGVVLEGDAHYKKEERRTYNVLTREVDYSFKHIPVEEKAKYFGNVLAGVIPKPWDYFHIQSIVKDGALHYTDNPMETYVPEFSFMDVNVNTIGSDTEPHYLNLITESAEGNLFEVEIRFMLPDNEYDN